MGERQGAWKHSKTCLKRNAIVPVFFFFRFHRFPVHRGSGLGRFHCTCSVCRLTSPFPIEIDAETVIRVWCATVISSRPQ